MEIKMLKEIKITKEEKINILGITLIEDEEYINNNDIISFLGERWWTKTPCDVSWGTGKYYVRVVEDHGGVPNAGVKSYLAVRPALIVSSDSKTIKRGDKIYFGGISWTAITGVNSILLLADESIGKEQFRAGIRAKDANDYEKSKIKKWLEEWYEDFLTNYKAS